MKNEGKNLLHYQRAIKVIPGGMPTNFRKFKGFVPTYMSHGEGARLFDIDGNEYIDYLLCYGPAILGYSNMHIRAAIARQAEILYARACTELEAVAAEKVCAHVPCADLVRFVSSGTEATANVFRVARAYTGRNMIVRFNGHYHGNSDTAFGGVVRDADHPTPQEISDNEGDLIARTFSTQGRARHAFHDCFLIEWNDLNVLRELLSSHGNDIAAICMEPINIDSHGSLPMPGYLQGVRKLCDEYGIVLIFDEVLTGFRIALGGAQAYFGVTPDLATLGKAIGGGMPISAFCGKKAIMDTITDAEVVAAGTFNAHPVSLAAVVATIEELERDGGAALRHVEKQGAGLAQGLRSIFKRYDIPLILQGFPACWTVSWSREGVIHNRADAMRQGECTQKASVFSHFLAQQGVLGGSIFMTSVAHTDEDIKETLIRADIACARFAEEYVFSP